MRLGPRALWNRALPGADAIILGSPTYFADVSTEMKALIDRSGMVGRANGDLYKRKIGAAVVAAVLYVQTDNGTVVVKTDDEDIQVLVKRGGQVHVADAKNRWRIEVKSGKYSVELKEGNDRFVPAFSTPVYAYDDSPTVAGSRYANDLLQ